MTASVMPQVIPAPFPLLDFVAREKWLAYRRTGLGGTDVAAILGKHAQRSALHVWLDKTGRADDTISNDAMEMGLELEPIIARRYAKQTGRRVVELPKHLIVPHPTQPWAFCSPDGFVDEFSRGLELKSVHPFAAGNFGEPGTDDVPDGYLVQVLWCLHVTGLDEWDLAALCGYDTSVYHIARDRDLCAAIEDQAGEWWHRHIVQDQQPAIDGSEHWSTYLKKRFPRNTLPMVAADSAAHEMATQLHAARQVIADMESQKARYENELKAIIGAGEGVEGDGWSITWRASKDGTEIDWESIVGHLRTEMELLGVTTSQLNAIVLQHTRPRPGSRRFLFKPTKE